MDITQIVEESTKTEEKTPTARRIKTGQLKVEVHASQEGKRTPEKSSERQGMPGHFSTTKQI